MQLKKTDSKSNPRETANLLSRIFFWWTINLFRVGANGTLELSDLYRPLRVDESERLGDMLEGYWNEELRKLDYVEYITNANGERVLLQKSKMPRLYIAICRMFWKSQLVIFVTALLWVFFFRTLQPILQGQIIKYFDTAVEAKPNTSDALISSACLALNLTLGITLYHHYFAFGFQLGMRMRVACSSLVYRKTLRISKAALVETTTGQIINMLSNDVSRFDDLPPYINYIVVAPLHMIVLSLVIWKTIGAVALVGVAAIVVLGLPAQILLAVVGRSLRSKIAVLTDKRVQLMNELIEGVQVIKLYAWEKSFAQAVSESRICEMAKLKISLAIRGILSALVLIIERLILYLSLGALIYTENDLSAQTTYELANHFNILQISLIVFFPYSVLMYQEARVSIQRLEKYLLLEEVNAEQPSRNEESRNGTVKFNKLGKKKADVQETIERYSPRDSMQEDRAKSPVARPVSLELKNVSANWIPGQLPPTLCNVCTRIEAGELCAVIGPVGAGKSALLHLILGELPVGAGSFFMCENENEPESPPVRRERSAQKRSYRISYASQEPWLFGGTVRENILFGKAYENEKYHTVTRVCALTKDFQQFPHGDQTLVDERGASLSGGQRARINLARAIYQEADIYLLDDPLSAVDAPVAKHLFKKCIKEYLRGKTRILVTHQLQFLTIADKVIVLDHGFIKMQGSYMELAESSAEFMQMIHRIKNDANKAKDENTWKESRTRQSFTERRSTLRGSVRRQSSIKSTNSSVLTSYDEDCPYVADVLDAEKIGSGEIPFKVYLKYFRYGASSFTLLLLAASFALSQLMCNGNDYWVSYWTNLEALRKSAKNGTARTNAEYDFMFNSTLLSSMFTLDENGLLPSYSAFYVYTFCIVTLIVIIFTRSFFFIGVCISSSRNLHNTMFANILHATMKFFHHNPSGRILNRFSKDTGAMDELLPKAMLEATQVLTVIAGVFVMITIINYWMLIPMSVVIVLFYFLRKYYIRTAQNVKRLEGTAKSPVFSHMATTLLGLTTIRSSGKETMVSVRKEFDRLQDIHTGVWFLNKTIPEAFGLCLDLITAVFIFCLCLIFIMVNSGDTLGGNVGLALTQALILVGTLQYGIRQSTEMIAQMTAVERILEYTNLPKEGPLTSDDPPPPSWPSKGELLLRNVCLRYSKEDDPVLKNLNIVIEPGWKVGVVGRTGAGKSSLISVLFRLYAEGIDGEIRIDGRDTSTLGLHELRSRISIIPQEPVLFSKSLRYNLDPFSTQNDLMLWEVLREVEFNDAVLDQEIQSGGTNLSVGQRQLICLARAILKNNRILVLDEATANIDSHTDSLVQKTIRSKFIECTVITIAHRLNTIIDSDRIIVMDAGSVVEFDTPYELLRDKPNGHFAQMVQKTGKEMARILFQQAEQKYLQQFDNHSERNSIGSSSDTIVAKYTL